MTGCRCEGEFPAYIAVMLCATECCKVTLGVCLLIAYRTVAHAYAHGAVRNRALAVIEPVSLMNLARVMSAGVAFPWPLQVLDEVV